MTSPLCKCGHPASEHDQGCAYHDCPCMAPIPADAEQDSPTFVPVGAPLRFSAPPGTFELDPEIAALEAQLAEARAEIQAMKARPRDLTDALEGVRYIARPGRVADAESALEAIRQICAAALGKTT